MTCFGTDVIWAVFSVCVVIATSGCGGVDSASSSTGVLGGSGGMAGIDSGAAGGTGGNGTGGLDAVAEVPALEDAGPEADACTDPEGCCPQENPPPRSNCAVTKTCTYDLAEKCSSSIQTSANCVSGRWDSVVRATCEPLPAGATCNPVGTWVLTVGEFDYSFPGMAQYKTLPSITVSLASDNSLLMNDTGSVSDGGCQMDVSHSESTSLGTQGSYTWIDHVTLQVDGDSVSGILKVQCWGECGWNSKAPVTGTRKQ